MRATLEPARLRLREARLREALVASMQEGFFVRDERGMITDVNDVFGTITGYGPADLPYAEPYPWTIDPAQEPDLGQLYSRVHAEVLAAEQGRYTVPIRHRDGRQRWVDSIVRAIPGWGRPGQVLLGTPRDVTDEHNAAAREAAVSRLATGLAGAADIGQVLTALAEVRQAFGARRAVAAIWPPHAPVLVAGLPETGGWPTLGAAARSGLEAARFHQIPHLAVEAGGGGQPTSVASQLAAGGGEAAIWLDRGARGPLTLEDRVLFGVLSAHLGNALARAIHYEQARDLAVALQHSVLRQTTLLAGFGVRYRPAMRPLEVGGDWYDVISLGRDRFGVMVGDCGGRGLDAAVTMGQLRSACRALLLRDAAPAQVLTDLDSFAGQVSGAACSTVFCAIIDVAAASIRYSSAGHPPRILAHPGGSCPELLDQATSVPLAVTAGQQRTEDYLGQAKKYSRMVVPHGGYIFPAFDLNHSYEDCDVFVSLAKMKEHATAGITLSMKNCFGLTPATIYGYRSRHRRAFRDPQRWPVDGPLRQSPALQKRSFGKRPHHAPAGYLPRAAHRGRPDLRAPHSSRHRGRCQDYDRRRRSVDPRGSPTGRPRLARRRNQPRHYRRGVHGPDGFRPHGGPRHTAV